jgi:hypothetical protein
MAARRRKKQKTVWSQDEEDRLLAAVLDYQKDEADEADEVDLDVVDWDAISQAFSGKTQVQCAQKAIHVDGKYFATIEEIWPVEKRSLKSLGDWDACKASMCCEKAPNFERLHFERDRRDPKEYVGTYTVAHLATTTVGESITTVNDDLIPVDILGQTIAAADKAHLLPKARDDALLGVIQALLCWDWMCLMWLGTLLQRQCWGPSIY